MSVYKKKVFINISEIASFIGKNPYDYVTPFNRLWKKCDSEEYEKLLNELNKQVDDTKIELDNIQNQKKELEDKLNDKKITKKEYSSNLNKIQKKESTIKQTIKDISEKVESVKLSKEEQVEKILGKETLNIIQKEDISTESKRQKTIDTIDNLDISENEKAKIKKTVENVINTTHGTLKEDSAIAQFEKKFKVKLDTSQQYHKRQLVLDNNRAGSTPSQFISKYDWYIGGKVDGLYLPESKKGYVVEVKNRTKSFFNSLRDYEKCQIQLYLWILDLEEAKLVEKHKDKIRVTAVLRDNDFIEDILEFLQIFINNFETKFLKDHKLKLEFLNASDDQKKVFLSRLYLSEITICANYKLEKRIIDKESEENCLVDDLD